MTLTRADSTRSNHSTRGTWLMNIWMIYNLWVWPLIISPVAKILWSLVPHVEQLSCGYIMIHPPDPRYFPWFSSVWKAHLGLFAGKDIWKPSFIPGWPVELGHLWRIPSTLNIWGLKHMCNVDVAGKKYILVRVFLRFNIETHHKQHHLSPFAIDLP